MLQFGGRRFAARAALLISALLAAACSSVSPEELADRYFDGELRLDDVTALPAPDTDADPALDIATDADEPLTIDRDVVIGTLDNGLTYYLRENSTPGGEMEIRLVVRAGSMQQVDAGDGVAHFLEHMLFNGTEAFPGNELDRALQSLGLAFGADTNAYTSHHETVYFLRLSTFDDEAIETGFDVLAEWAQSALIEPDEVENEIGIVRDEFRQGRETVDGIVFTELEEYYAAGTPYEGRWPIGDPDRIESTQAAELRAFYDRWYHPGNMAIVVVGDLPLDEMRREIEDRFDDFEARTDDPGTPEPVEITTNPDPVTGVVSHPDQIGDSISLDWLRPPYDPSTVGGARTELLDSLIAEMLTERTTAAYLDGSLELDRAPFISVFSIARELRYFGTNLSATDLASAYAQFLAIVHGAAEYGFTPAELDHAVTVAGSGLDAWEDGLDTTPDGAWADAYTNHFISGAGAEAPATTIARERAILESVTTDEVTARWAEVLAASGPLAVSITSDPTAVPSGDQLRELSAAVEPVRPVDTEADLDRLMDPPDPAGPIDIERRSGWSGTTMTWRYDNGATVVFEPSDIAAGVVDLYAESYGGYSVLPDGAAALVGLATSAVNQSGLGDASVGQVNRLVESTSASLEPYIDAEREGFIGASTPEDLEIVFQLLHLSMTAPRVDDTAFRAVLTEGELIIDSAQSDPFTLAFLELNRLATGGDFHSWIPTQAQLDTLTPEALLSVYESRLSTVDDLVISIVGDVDADEVASLAHRYIGTLPTGDADTFVDTQGSEPTGILRAQVPLPEGTANGGTYLLWVDHAGWDETDLINASVLEHILSSRIFETIREELGASYGGGASIDLSGIPRDTISAVVFLDGEPSRVNEITSRALELIADLRTNGPTADELDRARAVLEDEYGFVYNVDFMYENAELARDPEARLLNDGNRYQLLDGVTAGTVRDFVRRVFGDDAYIEVQRS